MPENKNQIPSPPENLPTEEDPLKELLKREEIKTMEKDVARLREVEAKQEREKISTIRVNEPLKTISEKAPQSTPQQFPSPSFDKAEKPLPPPPAPKEIPVPEKSPLDSLMPKSLPQKGSALKKVFVRGAVIFFFALILGVFLYFTLKNKPEEIIIPNPQATTTQSNDLSPFPRSLIANDQTKIIEISKDEDLSLIFSQVLAENAAEASLTRILVKNTDENRFLSLGEEINLFFASVKTSVPDEILEKLEEDYTLAILSQKEGNRLAFVARTKDKQGLIELLKKWEKETAGVSSFKTASAQGTLFRYLTLGKNDLGICYLVLDDYFVLTSSFQSMERIIKELNFEKKLGQLLMVGFEGKTLTPELEAFFKKYKPGAFLLLSKNIGSREELKTLTSQLQALSLKETGLPLLIAADQEGGPITRVDFLPEKTPQKEIGDNERASQVGETRGRELKEVGINLNLAPVLDWSTAGDFLFDRSFQKPAEVAGDLAKSLVSGQKSSGILSSIKHFPGYSGITFNPENKLAELEAIPEISQFKKAMEANPEFVMTSNVIYKEINTSLPFSFSSQAIQLLKNSLGESVLILSDDLAQDSLINKFSLKEVVVKPVEAGVDILIFSGYKVPVEQGLDEFLRAYKNGEISKEKAEKAILRITQLKTKLLLIK